jgi:hypothetical protein
LDWLTFISTIVKALAWPSASLLAVIIFKKYLVNLFAALGDRLLTAKGAGFELTFGKRVDEVEDTLPTAEVKVTPAAVESRKVEAIVELSQLPPPYIVSQAWLRLENAIRAGLSNLAVSRTPRPVELISLAVREGVLTQDELPAVSELRELRNIAAHAIDHNITITDALRYDDIANSLIRNIEGRRNRNPH